MSSLSKLPSEINRERLLDSTQSAEFLNSSVPHFRRLYRSGKVPPPIKIGDRKYAWKLGTLIDFVSAKTNDNQNSFVTTEELEATA